MIKHVYVIPRLFVKFNKYYKVVVVRMQAGCPRDIKCSKTD